ncbi:MAG: DUF3300 domain-containing protein [Xanthobacteraceae bacterium]|nr:DUF3300 domain-containing protein [Xanthobacteraceae bacterium]
MGVAALVGAVSLSMAQPAPDAAVLRTPEQVERLVAPIALYPDPLVAQILMAATYPLEIVEANRWLHGPGNMALKADALAAALQQQPWDPSVKSLVAFPDVLQRMDGNLGWTEQLGDTFLAQQTDVMDAIQRLRRRAKSSGALLSTPQQTIATDDQDITIEPANPDLVYVPAYDPSCAYGAWPYPDAPPYAFGAWSGSCGAGDLLAFGPGFYPFGFWAWGHFDWRRRHIAIDHDRFERFHTSHEAPAIWQHDPGHRHGVPYRDAATAARFLGSTAAGRGYRGFVSPPGSTPVVKPGLPSTVTPAIRSAVPSIERGTINRPAAPNIIAPQRPAPPAFESFGRGAQVREESARGFSSRMAPPMPAPSFHAAPMPSAPVGGGAMPAFRGGGGMSAGGHPGGRR